MPEQETKQRAERAKREGKSPSTQAGEFVREEMHHIREGKHGARSTKQAIAIGLSKARREGVALPAPAGKRKPAGKRRSGRAKNPRRSRAVSRALAREPRRAASKKALSRQARQSARRRGPQKRRAQARKAARTRKRTRRKASHR
jgi:hypothetical protein